MLTARSYWCVGTVFRSLYEELASSYALCFRELGMPENHAPTLRHYLLQDFAYSYRAWITLIKLSYARRWYLKTKPDIHQGERLCARLLPLVLQVSEKNPSRQPVNRSKLLECVLQFSLLIKCTLPKESCHAQQATVGRQGSRHLCTPGGWGPTRAE